MKDTKKSSEIYSLLSILFVFTLASFFTNFGLKPIVVSSILSGSFLVWINSEESKKLKETFLLNSLDSKNLLSINIISCITVVSSLFFSSLPQSWVELVGTNFSSSEEMINFFSILNFSCWILLIGNFLFAISSFIYLFVINLFYSGEIPLGEAGLQLEEGLGLLLVALLSTQGVMAFAMVFEKLLNG